ncbi:MAG: zinc ribbon domain-containing protein [Opitutae bacterium]|nr:zinc ribbon domain-containing protein [Opitutae bacterium]
MPTYEYECPKCREEFEVFQSMKAAPLKTCPKCGKAGVKRKIGGGAGLIFKGSGFYITDYKKKDGAPAPAAESKPAAPAAEAKPAAGTKPAAPDSKPAAAAPAKKETASKSAAKAGRK